MSEPAKSAQKCRVGSRAIGSELLGVPQVSVRVCVCVLNNPIGYHDKKLQAVLVVLMQQAVLLMMQQGC